MLGKINSKSKFRKFVFGFVFALMGFGLGLAGPLSVAAPVYAEPVTEATTVETTDLPTDSSEGTTTAITGTSCEESLGALGWLVCPTTGKISEAVDWLYEKIEDILVINPVEAKEGQPIYEIWKYFRGVTNVVFIIFLLVVIYSQITGAGISNYGVKRALPKLIVAAVLVNLSFIICSLAVDVSNVIGNGLRGLFESIEATTMANMAIDTSSSHVAMAEMYSAMAGGTALAIGGGLIAFETGAIWMLIPVALGAVVAVASGLITIALRQAVVALLIMIAPLAIVAYILPNTEQWFRKWKQLLTRMLVFYPAFSLLFGASSLAGWAIIVSSSDGFGILLGTAVQIFPLFFSWKLMKMSGTFLETVNSGIRRLASGPLATNRAWAESHREFTKQKNLASGNVYTPTLRLRQFLANRKISREEETKRFAETVRSRGLAYDATRNYKDGDLDGVLSRRGRRSYEAQARNMEYMGTVRRDKANFDKGFGYRAQVGTIERMRLDALDAKNVKASDRLRMEIERAAQIDYDNAKGFYDRIADAKKAHDDAEALRVGNLRHQLHSGVLTDANLERYDVMKRVMEGKDIDTNFILAGAAHSFNAQAQVVRGKFNDLFSYTAPTQDLVNILSEMTKLADSNSYMDPIIAGMRTLNARGDTDLLMHQLKNVLEDKKVELGTYASQSLANFFMFDVKGNDPFLRRFGKFINLETAKMYNEDEPGERRTKKDISLDEYVNGEYIDYDENGNMLRDEDGKPKIRKVKRGAATLLKGTSFKDMERTAIAEMNEAIRESSVDIDENGNRVFNYEKFKKNQAEIWDAIMPNIISDQFSFLSGSEQITALGKGLTGMDVQKHSFDWKGIFGEEIANSLTPEQKKDYLDFMNKRTKTFLGGQVPSQIAKTKTDILESIRNQYAFKDAMETDPEFFSKGSKNDFKMNSDEYREFERARMEKIRKEFVGSYKEDALKGFVKMHHKGYQGEAKDGLIQLLNPDELYQQYFGSVGNQSERERRRRQQIDDEEDDGMPVDFDGGFGGEALEYSEIRNNVESVFEDYRGVNGMDVGGFWRDIKPLISEMPDIEAMHFIDEIENSLEQYTSVAALYAYIVNRLFGGFE